MDRAVAGRKGEVGLADVGELGAVIRARLVVVFLGRFLQLFFLECGGALVADPLDDEVEDVGSPGTELEFAL